MVAAACTYGVLSLTRYATNKAHVSDLVIFDQAIRNYAHFHAPVSVARGWALTPPTNFSLLSDHISPILILLAPLYWIHDSPADLLLAQAVLVAAAIWPLWVFTRRALGPTAAYLTAFIYALSWPVAAAINFDFHEAAFAPLLMGILYERFQAGRKTHVVLAAVAVMLVKEDMGLFLAGFGLMLLFYQGWRRFGAALLAGGFAATWLDSRVLVQLAGGDPNHYWQYPELGPTISKAAIHVFLHPLNTLSILFHPATKTDTLRRLFLPLAFAPLLSPMLLPAIPLLAERMLSDQPNWWSGDFHHNLLIAMPLTCAAVDTAARLAKHLDRLTHRNLTRPVVLTWAIAATALTVAALPGTAFDQLVHSKLYHQDPRYRAALAASNTIPDHALVEVPSQLGPALTTRTTVVEDRMGPFYTPWILFDIAGFGSPQQQQTALKPLLDNHYTIRFYDDGYLVLYKPCSPTSPPSAHCYWWLGESHPRHLHG
jgi:uncharacterized membrane protein